MPDTAGEVPRFPTKLLVCPHPKETRRALELGPEWMVVEPWASLAGRRFERVVVIGAKYLPQEYIEASLKTKLPPAGEYVAL